MTAGYWNTGPLTTASHAKGFPDYTAAHNWVGDYTDALEDDDYVVIRVVILWDEKTGEWEAIVGGELDG